MPKQKFHIKTTNGTVDITRSADVATITEDRTCFGFREQVVTVVTKLDNTCMHYAFEAEEKLKENFKSH